MKPPRLLPKDWMSKVVKDFRTLYEEHSSPSGQGYREAIADVFFAHAQLGPVLPPTYHSKSRVDLIFEFTQHSGSSPFSHVLFPISPEQPDSPEHGQPDAELLSQTRTEAIPEKREIDDLRMECERLRMNLMEVRLEQIEAKNRAEQADERVDELLMQHRSFLELVKRVEVANEAMQRSLDARRTGKLCMHDKNDGYVARQLDEDLVAIEFETSDNKIVEQVHHRDQFIDGKLPQEGDRIEAHVLAWLQTPEPADASKYLTPEELEHGFPGFQQAIERRQKEEQTDRT